MTIDLKIIEARADAATKGPWEAKRNPDKFDDDGKLLDSSTTHLWHIIGPPAPGDKAPSHICGMGGFSERHQANAVFAAAARDDVPALVARVRELEEELRIAGSMLEQQKETFARALGLPRVCFVPGAAERVKKDHDDALTALAKLQHGGILPMPSCRACDRLVTLCDRETPECIGARARIREMALRIAAAREISTARFVVRCRYIASFDRPAGVGYLEPGGQCTREPRYARQFDNEADAWEHARASGEAIPQDCWVEAVDLSPGSGREARTPDQGQPP